MPYWRLFYHFVWATKDRQPLISRTLQEPLYSAIRAKVKEQKGIVHALNGMADHVHLVVSIPPTMSLATFIGQIKGSSSHLASHLGGETMAFSWQAEYGVVSVSETQVAAVVKYVQLQQRHHKEQTLLKVFETCA